MRARSGVLVMLRLTLRLRSKLVLTCDGLPRFYEKQGFVKIDDFVVDRKDGSKWPGTFFKMELGE